MTESERHPEADTPTLGVGTAEGEIVDSDPRIRASRRLSRPSRKTAIDGMCKHCIYDPFSGLGTWRQQVESCTATGCPLWSVRPLSSRTASSDRK